MAISKMVVHRLKYSRAVIATGRHNIVRAAEMVARRFGGMDAARGAAELEAYCVVLEQQTERFAGAERALAQDEAEDSQVREACDEAGAHLGRVLVAARARVREALGAAVLRQYGLTKRLPASREGLLRYGGDVESLLRGNPRRATDVFGAEFTTESLLPAVQQAVAKYQQTLGEVAREARETESARAERDAVEREFGVVLVNVAAILEAYFRMAGLDAAADRVRPTRARTSGEEDIVLEDDGDTGDGDIGDGDIGGGDIGDGDIGDGDIDDIGDDAAADGSGEIAPAA